MITVCWLLGSAVGIRIAKQVRWHLNGFVLLGMFAYFFCIALLGAAPFNTRLWPVYAALIMVIGLYPGVFFGRLTDYYSARQLFFRENNGFIVGLMSGTLLFLALGRAALWGMPILLACIVMICTTYFFRSGSRTKPVQESITHPIEVSNIMRSG